MTCTHDCTHHPTTLTPREREVLAVYAEVWSWRRVADRLGISPRTARQHGDSARHKLGAARIGQAALLAQPGKFRSQ